MSRRKRRQKPKLSFVLICSKNKSVTNEPMFQCDVILGAWFVCHRYYLERTKNFVLGFVSWHMNREKTWVECFIFLLSWRVSVYVTNVLTKVQKFFCPQNSILLFKCEYRIISQHCVSVRMPWPRVLFCLWDFNILQILEFLLLFKCFGEQTWPI